MYEGAQVQKTKINGVSVTPQQGDIYWTLKRFGSTGLTDHALVGVATHEMKRPYSESSIRSRRAELARLGLLKAAGEVTTRSGRKALRWAVR
jgi:hypothetical protein